MRQARTDSRNWKALMAVGLGLLAASPAAAARPGDVDRSFGNGGIAAFDLGRAVWADGSSPFADALGVSVLADGRIAVAGGAGSGSGSTRPLGLRLTASGRLDSGFARGAGWAAAPVDGWAVGAFATPRGGITLGGNSSTSDRRPLAVQLTAAGDPDTTYGTGGFAPVPSSDRARVDAAVRQADGNLVLAGWAQSDRIRVQVVRYTASGRLDASFGSNGRALHQVSRTAYGDSEATGLALAPGGKLLIAGSSTEASAGSGPTSRYLFVGRLGANGAPDASFGSGGFARLPAPEGHAGQQEVVPTADGGALLVAGLRDSSQTGRLLVARFGPRGDRLGARLLTVGADPAPTALVIAPGGRVIAAGWTAPSIERPEPVSWVARLTATGAFDPNWGTGGIVTLSGLQEPHALGLQRDGRVLVAGATTDDANSWLAVTRLTGDSAPGAGAPVAVGRPVWRRGALRVRIRCRAARTCRGRVMLLPRKRPRPALARKRFRIPAGEAKRLKIRPRRRVRSARLRVTVGRASRTMVVRLR